MCSVKDWVDWASHLSNRQSMSWILDGNGFLNCDLKVEGMRIFQVRISSTKIKRNKEEKNWIIFNSLDNLYIFLFSILFLNNNHLGFCDLKLNFFFYLITNINPSNPNENDILLNFSIFHEVGILMFLWLNKNFPVGPKGSNTLSKISFLLADWVFFI